MTLLASIICATLAATAIWQTVFGLLFARLLYQCRPTVVQDTGLPFASILLPLRGADPQLAEGLRRLLLQDYPRYDLQIVVDRHEDPAWQLVQDVVHATGATNVHVSIVKERSQRCSPQCSALIQAVRNLDQQCEVVVIIDGDVLTHPTWLRELVHPLLDPTTGISHGNRWFVPSINNWGSLVRVLWNAGAVVPMHYLHIPWAGSLAIKKSVLLESGLFDLWPTTIVPDAPSKGLLTRMGLRICFVPSLMMVNRERCDLAFSHDFMKRQMMWTRIYHPNWAPVLLHAVSTSAVIFGALLVTVIAAVTGRWMIAGWVGGSFVVFLLTMASVFGWMEGGVRHVCRLRGDNLEKFGIGKWLKLACAIPLTQFVYLSAVFLATFQRQVTWRGITYRVRTAFDVTVVGDQPYKQAEELAGSNVSL